MSRQHDYIIRTLISVSIVLSVKKESCSPSTTGFRVLCPTRWTVKASLQSVLDNYEILMKVWEESLDSPLVSEISSGIIVVSSQRLKFEFLFGIFF